MSNPPGTPRDEDVGGSYLHSFQNDNVRYLDVYILYYGFESTSNTFPLFMSSNESGMLAQCNTSSKSGKQVMLAGFYTNERALIVVQKLALSFCN